MTDDRWRRPKTVTIDTDWLEAGEFGALGANPPADQAEDGPDALAMILRHLVERLPEPDRTCVEAVMFGRMSYEDASEVLWHVIGRKVGRKTVWRWTRRGLKTLKGWLLESPWASTLTEGRIPMPDGEVVLDPE